VKKVALITGGTRGIGFGIARALAAAGFDLVVNGLRPEADVAPALASLRAAGVDVLYCRGDVADRSFRQRMLDEARAHFGRLQVLVNNAGMAPVERRDILEATEESFEQVLRVNLQGPYFLTQSVARWMIEQRTELPEDFFAVINVGSISATFVSVNRGEYCVSKAGMAMATQLWSARLAEYGIPVYEIRPGIVDTDMAAGAKDKYDRLIAEGLVPQGRWGTPDDVGRAAAALAQGSFAFSTGQVVMVDGGISLARL
jgi:NAD(P)-dependent dehydrogenase (short-subunit alcohol dehydrogenase family)